MTRWAVSITALWLALSASAAGAQQWQVERDVFAFAGRQLTIEVDADVEGTLRIIRGAPGVVRIAGRADGGMTAAGLTGRGDLTLTGSGPGSVEFIVAVPERVRVLVRLPDRTGAESVAGLDASRAFHWGSANAHQERVETWIPQPTTGLHKASAYLVYAADLAPRTVSLPDLTNVRSIDVRVEGDRFRVGASRPLSLRPGDHDHLEIRPGAPAMDVLLVIPEGTDFFALTLTGRDALTVRGGELAVACAPHTRQWLSGNRGWVTFTPVEDAIHCDRTANVRNDS
jgi:hypothetical protein